MRTARLVVVLTFLFVAAGCGGSSSTPAPAAGGLGSRSDVTSWFTGQGFTGSESPLADGTPRWLANGPNSAIGEVTGDPAVSKVSLVVAASGESGTLSGNFLSHFAPGSTSFLADVIQAAKTADQDQSRVFNGRTVEIQTLNVSGGYLVTMSVS